MRLGSAPARRGDLACSGAAHAGLLGPRLDRWVHNDHLDPVRVAHKLLDSCLMFRIRFDGGDHDDLVACRLGSVLLQSTG